MMKRLVAVTFVLAIAGVVQAEEKANPTGTWKWSVEFNGQKRDLSVKLKLDGDKLTGSMPGRDNTETKIDDGKFKDGEVSFSVTRERGGQKFTQKFKGKISGDTIKGKIEFERDGKAQSRDWEAKRAAD